MMMNALMKGRIPSENKVALESEPPDIMDNMPRKSPVPPIKVSRVLALSPGMGI
jgi:hypothetical protein